MKKKMRIMFAVLFLAVSVAACMTAEVKADMGPKPSTVIDFENMDGEKYYVTLLSEQRASGPHIAYEGDGDIPDGTYGKEIWRAFNDYEDSDGFYFLQYYGEIAGDGRFTWGYYPPDRFKILLYFPESCRYAVSDEIYKRYAFDSYYTVDGSRIDFGSGTVKLTEVGGMGQKSYDYRSELFSLAARIVITVALELGIAMLFGFRKKYWLKAILFTNLVTQIALNCGLNAAAYFGGPGEAMLAYIVLEIGVIIAEYEVYLNVGKRAFAKNAKEGEKAAAVRGNGLISAYAVAANLASFFAGLGLAKIMPGIF